MGWRHFVSAQTSTHASQKLILPPHFNNRRLLIIYRLLLCRFGALWQGSNDFWALKSLWCITWRAARGDTSGIVREAGCKSGSSLLCWSKGLSNTRTVSHLDSSWHPACKNARQHHALTPQIVWSLWSVSLATSHFQPTQVLSADFPNLPDRKTRAATWYWPRILLCRQRLSLWKLWAARLEDVSGWIDASAVCWTWVDIGDWLKWCLTRWCPTRWDHLVASECAATNSRPSHLTQKMTKYLHRLPSHN